MKDLKARMHHFILSNQLFEPTDRILLAVSGGKDSICLSHLFKACGFNFALAHCNFQLRGKESDEDAKFVSLLAKQLEVDYFHTAFETDEYAKKQKVSIQMAARDLRYQWLEKIRSDNEFSYIATAHHLNDSIETVIYNFSKGCGIRGLHGILPVKNMLIRPLIFASKKEIEVYTQKNNLDFREDDSNASEKYSRNFIRHQIIPKLITLNPSFEQSTGKTLRKIRETEWLFNQSVKQFKSLAVHELEEEILIDLNEIPDPAAQTLLFEFLSPFGFNSDQVGMILNQQHQSGAYFNSETHTLLIDRNTLIVRKTTSPSHLHYTILEGDHQVELEHAKLELSIHSGQPDSFPPEREIALLDYNKLAFPLLLRPWEAGDQFQPFGMLGKHQKIQDFLTHLKLNRFEKQKVYVMVSEGQICWVVGFRIDERYKIGLGTKKFARFEVAKNSPARSLTGLKNFFFIF